MQTLDRTKLNSRLQVITYTKLMEQLDVAQSSDIQQLRDAAAGVTEIKVCGDPDGCDVVFANAPGKGVICWYFGGGAAPAGGTLVPLHGERTAAGIDAEGYAHIFALRDRQVYYVKEKRPHSGAFGPEMELGVTVPKGFTGISQLEAVQLRDGLALAVVCETEKGTAYVSVRMAGDTYDYLMPVAFSRGRFAFSGRAKGDLCVHQAYAEKGRSFYAACTVEGKDLRVYELGFAPGVEVSGLTLLDDEVFLLSTDARLWGLSLPGGRAVLEEIGESAVTEGISLCRGQKDAHIAAVDSSGRLLHFEMWKQGEGYRATAPFPIDKDVGPASFRPAGGDVVLYYYSRQSDGLVRLSYDPEQKNWNETAVHVPDPDVIQRASCYSTELTLLDPEKKVPHMDREVEIWTKQQTYLKTVDGFQLCDESHRLRLRTDVRGKVSFAQYANKIDVPTIYASLPEDLLESGQLLAFCQSDSVSSQLEGVTPQQVLDAKTTDSMGEGQDSLLPEKFRSQENAEAIASALGQLMGLRAQAARCSGRSGAYLIRREEAGALGRVTEAAGQSSWSFRVEGNRLAYQTLTREEAEQRAVELREGAVFLSAPVFKSIFSSIADFFRGVAKKIVNLVEVIFDGIKATVKCILDTVSLVFECVIGTIGEILDFVETIFAAVAVFFVGLFAWLAALFQWKDVKRTQRALDGALRVFFEELPTVAGTFSRKIPAYLAEYEAALDAKIDAICQELLPDQPLLEYASGNIPSDPAAEEAMSNDYLLERLLRSNGVSCVCLEETAQYQDVAGDIVRLLEEFADSISGTEEFTEAFQYFKKSFTSVDSLFQNLMVSLLYTIKGLLHLILRGAAALTAALFDAVEALCGLLLELLTKPIRLPFFSDLYRLMTGDEMTLLNLLAFVTSVPVVMMHKLFFQRPPFESDGEVERFLADCRRVFRMEDGRDSGLTWIDPKWHDVVTVTGSVLGFSYNMVSAVSDSETCYSPPYKPGEKPPERTVMDILAWTFEVLWLVFSAPWWFASEKEPAKDYSIALWVYFLFGIILDGVFLWKDTHIDKAGWKGRLCTALYGFFHFLLILSITMQEKPKAEEYIPDFFGSAAEMTKLLIDLDVSRSESTSWCVWPVCATDALTALAVAGCGIAQII